MGSGGLGGGAMNNGGKRVRTGDKGVRMARLFGPEPRPTEQNWTPDAVFPLMQSASQQESGRWLERKRESEKKRGSPSLFLVEEFAHQGAHLALFMDFNEPTVGKQK